LNRIVVRLPAQSPAPDETTLGVAAIKVLREAQSIQKNMHDSYIAQDHLLLALIQDSSIQPVLKEAGLSEAALKTALNQTRGSRRVDTKNAEEGFDALNKYATDLTALAADGKIDPVIGRDAEIRRIIRILCRRTKNNPVRSFFSLFFVVHFLTEPQVLIGEPGVGKTAVVEVSRNSIC
jgi:ATP-dependent Clp protease ATP-binding subunit ClpB